MTRLETIRANHQKHLAHLRAVYLSFIRVYRPRRWSRSKYNPRICRALGRR